ncbi:MAG: hypothetical protein ACI4GC_04405 [Acutalibacteraceae bacterium]
MKKFLSVAVAVLMCVCLMAPTAFAAEEGLASLLEGVDLGALSESDIAGILGNLGLENLDIAEIEKLISGEDVDTQVKVEQALQDVQASAPVSSGIDLSQLAAILPMDTSAFVEMFKGFDAADTPALLNTISDSMSGAGVDMASFDLSSLGSFDITSVLTSLGGASNFAAGGGDISSTVTNAVSGLADTLLGGLSTLGLDTSAIEGLLDNEIVNFFANMYIGFIGKVDEKTTTAAPTTTAAAVPTGDSTSVVAAVAVLGVASVAAGVCLKKKDEE